MLELSIGRALARCGSRAGFEVLIAYLEDNRSLLAEGAHSELAAISGDDYGKDAASWKAWLERQAPALRPCPVRGRPDLERTRVEEALIEAPN